MIVNMTADLKQSLYRQRAKALIHEIILHRTGYDKDTPKWRSAQELIANFSKRKDAKGERLAGWWTGGKIPYHFLLLENGTTRQMLIEAQQADLQLYEYVRRELYPAFQREYGPRLEADVARYRESQSNGFNLWNLTACRLKHYAFYDPLLRLYRRGIKLV